MRCKNIIFIVFLVGLFSGGVQARPTTADEAAMVVTGWLKTDPQPLAAPLGQQVMNVETFPDDNGGPVYYIVYLQPSGFVIVPADDLVEPIIGFADDGLYEPSAENPLGALVTADLSARIAAVRDEHDLRKEAEAQGRENPDNKWRRLIDLAEDRDGGFELMVLMHPGDIRVLPLVQSKWSQAAACGEYCYNYYTPFHNPAGCVATAMAQLMRYHEHPTDPIGVHEFMISVSGSRGEQKAYTRGGDGLGGPYDWNAMVLRPEYNCGALSEANRQAIGALCYDAGVAIETAYTSNNSGAMMPDVKEALVSVFQYSSAVLGYDPESGIHSGLMEMINPNLDAGAPVILAVSNPLDAILAHALVCDGYGYQSTTLYHHLNMGWHSVDDAWYNLPDINGVKARYSVVFTCIYNIFTTGKGEIISGRVLDPAGQPIVNARVFAERGDGATHTAATDERGIYALVNLDSDAAYMVWPQADGCVFSSRSVETRRSRDNSGLSGNRWGVDFYAESAPNPPAAKLIYVDADAPLDPGPGEPVVSDPDEDGSIEHPFDAIQQAIDAAVSGDTVIILRGTYSGDGNRDLDFKGKAITVRSEDPNDPNFVIIECGGTADNPHRGFEFHQYETPSSVLDGLTITGGYHERGGGMYCGDGARPTVTHCTFRGNSAILGGGLYNDSSPKLTNCLFSNNSADGGGGAIHNNMSATATLTNCLFIENAAATCGGAIRNSNGAGATLTNCTFFANSAANGRALACTPDDGGSQAAGALEVTNCILWDAGDEIINDDNSIITVTYSNVQGGSAEGSWPGEGNMNADPYFADPSRHDYHLKSQSGRWDPSSQSWIHDTVTSPCIDAGDTSTPIGLEPLPNGGIVNMGTYGGTAEASKSHFGSAQSK